MKGSTLVFLCGLVTYTAGSSLSFRASPRVSVEGITDDLSFKCRSPPSVNEDVYAAVLIVIEKTDVNGTQSTLAAQRVTRLDYDDDGENRTFASAHVQKSESDEGSFLDVTISKPVIDDSGMYQCRFIYVDLDYQVVQLADSVNITVSGVPPPNYVPQAVGSRGDCDCDQMWDEIDDVKGNLMVENEKLKDTVGAYDDSCRVSFSVQFGQEFPYVPITDGQVIFTEVTNNKGGAYDKTTGIFTAPCAGQYFFSLTLRSVQRQDAGSVHGLIMVDGKTVAQTAVYTDAPFDNYQSDSNSAVVSLKPGQEVKVEVKTTSSGEFMTENFSIFNGFFLFP